MGKIKIARTRAASSRTPWKSGGRPQQVAAGYTVFADGQEVATISRDSICWEVWFRVDGANQKRNFSTLAQAKAWATERFGD